MKIIRSIKAILLGYIAYKLLTYASLFIVLDDYKNIPYALMGLMILEIILLFRKEKYNGTRIY